LFLALGKYALAELTMCSKIFSSFCDYFMRG
jgi:hypothetical protein